MDHCILFSFCPPPAVLHPTAFYVNDILRTMEHLKCRFMADSLRNCVFQILELMLRDEVILGWRRNIDVSSFPLGPSREPASVFRSWSLLAGGFVRLFGISCSSKFPQECSEKTVI